MKIEVQTVEEFNEAELPDIPSFVGDGLVVPEGRVILYADPGTYKSFAMMQFCYALAKGQDWLGYKVHRPLKTMYLQTELIDVQIQKRSRAMTKWYGETGVLIGNIRDFGLRTSEDWEALHDVVAENGIEYVVLDPLAAVMAGSEIDELSVKFFTESLDHLCKTEHTGVALVHHGRKKGHNQQGAVVSSGQMDLRGHSRLSAWPDTIMYLEKDNKGKLELQMQKIRNGPPEIGRWLRFDDEYGILVETEEDPYTVISAFLADGPMRNQACIEHMQTNLGWVSKTFQRHRDKWVETGKMLRYRDPINRSYWLLELKEEKK